MAKCEKKKQVDNARKVQFDGENVKSEENTMAPLGVPPSLTSRLLSDKIAELSHRLNDALSGQPHVKSKRRWICWFHSQYGFRARKCEKVKGNNSCVCTVSHQLNANPLFSRNPPLANQKNHCILYSSTSSEPYSNLSTTSEPCSS